jgi:DNA polymerase III alpha subunit
MNCELTLRIIELVIAASIPALIAIIGFRLTGKREEIKNESASKYLWRTKWNEILFQKHLEYCNNITELLSECNFYSHHIKKTKDPNSEESKRMQENIDALNRKIAKASIDVEFHSRNLFGENNEIEILLNAIWTELVNIVNNEQGNTQTLYNKLCELNLKTEELITKRKA